MGVITRDNFERKEGKKGINKKITRKPHIFET